MFLEYLKYSKYFLQKRMINGSQIYQNNSNFTQALYHLFQLPVIILINKDEIIKEAKVNVCKVMK